MIRRGVLPKVVYRVQLKRPKHGDSEIKWMTTSVEDIKNKYGDRIMLITPYRKD